jgi:hypothetical protein
MRELEAYITLYLFVSKTYYWIVQQVEEDWQREHVVNHISWFG